MEDVNFDYSAEIITEKDIEEAYLKLKSAIYYDKYIFYKNDLADFEYQHDLNKKFKEIHNIVISDNIEEAISQYINEIDFYVLPKKLEHPIKNDRSLFSNKIDCENYKVTKLNYFIKVPIELQIIDVLWLMKIGSKIQYKMPLDYSYANVLDINKKGHFKSTNLFKKYFNQYSKWRDDGITKAQKLNKDKKNCVIFSLDIERYYYNVDLNYKMLDLFPNNKEYNNLLTVLKAIHKKYRKKLKKYVDEQSKLLNYLPIGLQSSGLLANWYLEDFDSFIQENLAPAHYGRYVDDILCVFEDKTNLKQKGALIKHFFGSDKLFKKIKLDENSSTYQFSHDKYSSLKIQPDKFKIFHLNSGASSKILENFKADIQSNSSEFRFLPSLKELDKEFSSKMFNLNYTGSSNIMRNIDDFILNRYNTSVYLAKKIKLALYVKEEKEHKDEFLSILNNDIRGCYKIEFYDYWFKMFEYLLVKNYSQEFKDLYNDIRDNHISKIVFEASNPFDETLKTQIENKLKKQLKEYLFNSASLAFALNPRSEFKFYHFHKTLVEDVKKYRNSNLIDNNRIFIPLYNYTLDYLENTNNAKKLNDFKNLLEFNYSNLDDEKFHLSEDLIKYAPINIYDSKKQLFTVHKDIIFSRCKQVDTFSEYSDEHELNTINDQLRTYTFDIPNSNNFDNSRLKIALINFSIPEEEAVNFLDKKLDDKRYEEVRKMLRYAQEKKCKLAIFPEMIVPFEWLNLIYEEARTKEIGIIAGVKHFINNDNCCLNLLCTILPYKNNEYYKDAFIRLRMKNHYSPKEIKEIKILQHTLPEKEYSVYDLFHWNNVFFSNYNCFEISSIEDRSIFKGKVDFITLSAYNSDTNYFNNIISSTSRDLHCGVAHVNNSEFGYSCFALPKETFNSSPVIVKGGCENMAITYDFDFVELRKFQEQYNDKNDEEVEKEIEKKKESKGKSESKKEKAERYKDLPPCYEISKERKHSLLGIDFHSDME